MRGATTKTSVAFGQVRLQCYTHKSYITRYDPETQKWPLIVEILEASFRIAPRNCLTIVLIIVDRPGSYYKDYSSYCACYVLLEIILPLLRLPRAIRVAVTVIVALITQL